jgi:hypothetical protein
MIILELYTVLPLIFRALAAALVTFKVYEVVLSRSESDSVVRWAGQCWGPLNFGLEKAEASYDAMGNSEVISKCSYAPTNK